MMLNKPSIITINYIDIAYSYSQLTNIPMPLQWKSGYTPGVYADSFGRKAKGILIANYVKHKIYGLVADGYALLIQNSLDRNITISVVILFFYGIVKYGRIINPNNPDFEYVYDEMGYISAIYNENAYMQYNKGNSYIMGNSIDSSTLANGVNEGPYDVKIDDNDIKGILKNDGTFTEHKDMDDLDALVSRSIGPLSITKQTHETNLYLDLNSLRHGLSVLPKVYKIEFFIHGKEVDPKTYLDFFLKEDKTYGINFVPEDILSYKQFPNIVILINEYVESLSYKDYCYNMNLKILNHKDRYNKDLIDVLDTIIKFMEK